ncbi:flagellar biosynthetic protein FliO [Castellaniella sp.]|jgi:flagellar protein FliO/FliZ|uniref:flagellar biosynthetic protein FliO n=1 Tax=Castellaniella sp. TaxID=1955812 RepID=UPI002D7F3AB5|nr:flagellar biosynthetic protein FliO [Castellaniella sp.]HET8702814.1 flagellar biosynthetic protein FliO [Castellaniella sp.]
MDQDQILRVILALLFILGLLLVLAWVARRGGWLPGRAQSARLRVLGTLSLGARSSVALVQVEDARLVLGVTAQQITLLHTLPNAPGAGDASPGDFAEALGKALPGS